MSDHRSISLPASGSLPRVLVLDPTDSGRASARMGEIVDRSESEMRIRLDTPVIVGSMLRVRPALVTALAPWIEIEVTTCAESAAGWEITARPSGNASRQRGSKNRG